MENKKDIGKAFREKLDRLEMAPGGSVWDAISADLEKNKRSPKLTGWIKGVLLAVLSVVFITILLVWNNHSSGPENVGTDKEAKIENGQNVTDTSNDAGNSNLKHPGDKSILKTEEKENSNNTVIKNETYDQVRNDVSNGTVQKKQSSGSSVSDSKKSGKRIGKSDYPNTLAPKRRATTPENDGMPPAKNQIVSRSGKKNRPCIKQQWYYSPFRHYCCRQVYKQCECCQWGAACECCWWEIRSC
ncbi:MAG: hypothetical protein EOO20_18840 [Chryseobacterium sp.]|nr:MAG: hypothetical protein EOO20_18840 [Chryseobacterium sp.]